MLKSCQIEYDPCPASCRLADYTSGATTTPSPVASPCDFGNTSRPTTSIAHSCIGLRSDRVSTITIQDCSKPSARSPCKANPLCGKAPLSTTFLLKSPYSKMDNHPNTASTQRLVGDRRQPSATYSCAMHIDAQLLGKRNRSFTCPGCRTSLSLLQTITFSRIPIYPSKVSTSSVKAKPHTRAP